MRATAFTPEDAQAITRAILEKSSALVNQLAEQAREDAMRFARDELDEAEAHLREVRQQLADFRREHSLVDPSADVDGQSGLLTALKAELAKALVERDMLPTYADEGDQRVVQANRRIDARSPSASRTSAPPSGSPASPAPCPRWSAATRSSRSTSSSPTQPIPRRSPASPPPAPRRAGSRATSRRTCSRRWRPRALYPRRALLAGLTGLFLLLGWGVAMLVYYNVRDNR